MEKLNIGLVGSQMYGFTAEEAGIWPRTKSGIQKLSEEWDFNLILIDRLLESEKEAKEACKELEAQKVDFTLVQSTSCSFGDVILPFAQLRGDLGLWALPEPSYEGVITLNSLTGIHMFASILRQYLEEENIRYKWFFGEPDNPDFLKRLKVTLEAQRVLKGLRSSKIGVIGGISPGFFDVLHDEQAIAQRLGTIIEEVDLEEVFGRTKAYNTDQTNAVSSEMSAMATTVEVTSEWMEKISRVYLALQGLADERDWNAIALRCWPEFAEEMQGLGPCAALGWLNEKGIAAACEGDALAALAMLALQIKTGGPVTSMDWAGVSDTGDLVQLWHCGPSPLSLANKDGARLAYQPVLDTDFLVNSQHAGVITDLTLKEGPVTIVVLNKRADKMLVLSADFVGGPTSGNIGSRGWLNNFKVSNEPCDINDILETVMFHGLHHHFPLAYGDHVNVFLEVAAWAGIEVLPKITYREYLQSPI